MQDSKADKHFEAPSVQRQTTPGLYATTAASANNCCNKATGALSVTGVLPSLDEEMMYQRMLRLPLGINKQPLSGLVWVDIRQGQQAIHLLIEFPVGVVPRQPGI